VAQPKQIDDGQVFARLMFTTRASDWKRLPHSRW
jgi:hypothetical protein